MIRSFKMQADRGIYQEVVAEFQAIKTVALRKLEMLDAAMRL